MAKHAHLMASVAFVLLSSIPASALRLPKYALAQVRQDRQNWYRNDKAIPDEDMPAYTQLNEFTNVCVTPWAMDSIDPDWNDMFFLNASKRSESLRSTEPCQSLEPNWNGEGKGCGMVNFRFVNTPKDVEHLKWISEPTLALSSKVALPTKEEVETVKKTGVPRTNPGHGVADVLYSLYPRIHETDPYSQIWLTSDPLCKSWLCENVKEFHLMKTGHDVKALNEKGTTCFEKLYIPQLTRWRWTPNEAPNLDVSLSLREHLTKSFSAPEDYIMLYGHEDGDGRKWTNVAEIENFLTQQGYKVKRIPSMSSLSTKEQCRAFYDAKVVISSHGGHMGNYNCARSGTKFVELECGYVGWFSAADKMHEIMGFDWTGYDLNEKESCPKKEGGGSPDFVVPTSTVKKFVK